MDQNFFYFILYLIALAGLVVFSFAVWMAIRVRARREVRQSFRMKLFQVILPPYATKDPLSLEQLREKIALMEKLYANLHDAGPSGWFFRPKFSFALEITVPHIGEEIVFYVAAPRILGSAVAKMIESMYPDAQVTAVKDYNIFNPEGASVGGAVLLERDKFLPIRTYRFLEADPLSQTANAFSRIAREGEGAAVQIVIRPAPERAGKEILDYAKRIFERGEFRRKGMLKETGELLFGKAEHKKVEEKKPKTLTPKEDEMLRAIEAKGSKPLFETNIRLMASAPTDARAREILKDLESAFLQFENPELNKFSFSELRGSSLKDLFYRFSFRVFNPEISVLLSAEELASLFHFPNTPIETPKLKIAKSKEAPPPANIPQEGLLLGYGVFRGAETPVRMTRDDRRRHLYIIGQTGTGKTAFMKNMVRQDIEAGDGMCFIDPHGDTVEEILGLVPEHRIDDVIYFDPGDVQYPMGLNMLEYDPRYPEQKTFVVNELFSIFQKLYGAVPESLGPIFEQYFRNSTLLVMEDPPSGNTLLEIERVFVDKDFRDLKLSRSNNVVINTFWREIAEKASGEQSLSNYAPYITSKFDTFLANEIMRPIIAQEKSAFNFREVMDQKKILLINLSKGRLGELNSSLIGLIMVGKLLMAAFSRVDVLEQERKDFYVYIDEFQNVTTKSIATILSEARKYRLDLIITHQFVGQLEEEIKKAVFGNAGSVAAFRIGSDDAEFIAKQFEPVFSPSDLLNVDNYNAFLKLLINGQPSRPFNFRTYPPAEPKRDIAARIKEISRIKYGRPREEVEAEINKRYQKE